MTWTKLGAEFGDVGLDLTDAAWRTHVEALMYSNRRLLDLLVPKWQVVRFAGTADPDLAVKELVDAGWWVDRGDAWWIGVHFPEWQRDRIQIEHRRAQLAEAQRRKRRHDLGEHDRCLSNARCRQPSTVESAAESTVDTADDPERNGTEQKSSTKDDHNWPDTANPGGPR